MQQMIFGGFFMFDKKLLKAVATGAFCGLLTSVILMCILTVVLLKTGLPQGSLLDYLLAGFLGAGAFAGGFVAAKLNRGAGLVAGAAVGGVMFLALLIVAAIKGDMAFTVLSVVKAAAALLLGAAGGVLGVREKHA